ncbi:MAG: HAD family hydrolase [Bacteroidota bacterium]|nr:HAD family hydrolase [Bacteroidota bacterium]
MTKQKCVFLDRDGVLNVERGDYTYLPEDFILEEKVPEALALLKQLGFLLIVVTNQGGLAKGLYTKAQMEVCHQKLQQNCNYVIDAIYYAPSHPAISASLSRKPDSLMLEKAIAKFNIDPKKSWLVGDQLRDMQAAEKVGVNGILVGPYPPETYPWQQLNLWEAAQFIIAQA